MSSNTLHNHNAQSDIQYENVECDLSDSDSNNDDEDVLRMVKARKATTSTSSSSFHQKQQEASLNTNKEIAVGVENARTDNSDSVPPVIDDFIRNFLIKHKLVNTLDMFQTEWYELEQAGQQPTVEKVHDVYGRVQELEEQLERLEAQLAQKDDIAQKAKSTWDKFRKERDYHRMHHRRVIQEKNKLITDLKRLRKHYSKYEPMIKQLQKRYEDTSKEKMLLLLENDRLKAQLVALDGSLDANVGVQHKKSLDGRPSYQQETRAFKEKRAGNTNKDQQETTDERDQPLDSPFPEDYRENPWCDTEFPPLSTDKIRLSHSYDAHDQAIAALAVHPTKLVAITGSDDRQWKLWNLPQGDLIMTGDGHRDWIGGVSFHPSGTRLATASGDKTVKIWDLTNACCAHTFTDHTQAVWDVCFHECGDFVVSASMDHSARLWDLATQRCRQTFRGHVDSVNKVCFQPFTNNVCTASGDKTVSVWDMRQGLCVQTYYGHNNAVNHADFSLRGDLIVSADADGVVKVWDVRMMGETTHILTNTMRQPVNMATFDQSGQSIITASDDGNIQIYDTTGGQMLNSFSAHHGGAHKVLFDSSGQYLVSSGADGKVCSWTIH